MLSQVSLTVLQNMSERLKAPVQLITYRLSFFFERYWNINQLSSVSDGEVSRKRLRKFFIPIGMLEKWCLKDEMAHCCMSSKASENNYLLF